MAAHSENSPAETEPVWLNPTSVAIDGRDLRDKLGFVAQFSRLIWYYNSNNQVQGDWQDFFLKDPAILLAAISKTDYTVYHAQYLQLQQSQRSATVDSRWLSNLCLLIHKLCASLNLWLRNMRKHKHHFNLLEFLRDKIERQLAQQLQLLILLQQALKLHSFPDLISFEPGMLGLYEPEWRLQLGSSLQFTALHTAQDITDAINQLKAIYEACFDALVQVSDQAKQDFYLLAGQVCDFPDTALLRTFLRLSEQQQQRLNQLSAAHLNFYYQDLLFTQARPVKADQLYLNLRLNSKFQQFVLPKDSLFLGGSYPDQSPVLFTSVYPVELNQLSIPQLYTEYYGPLADSKGANNRSAWCFAAQAVSAQVQTDVQGQVLDFPFWGNQQATEFASTILVASPMFALAEGQRKITVAFEFTCAYDAQSLWQQAKYFLSTGSAWLDVSAYLGQINQHGFELNLPVTLPAIQAFATVFEGLDSQWPVLKIRFANDTDLSASPAWQNLKIEVEAKGLKQLKLANDLASLPAATPGLLFAPPARPNARFYLGCAEAFAKPLVQLRLQIDWDNLPVCLDAYYASYNYYLAGFPAQLKDEQRVFSNSSFGINAAILSQKTWTSLDTQFSYSMGAGSQQRWIQLAAGQSAQLFSQQLLAPDQAAAKSSKVYPQNLPCSQFLIEPTSNCSGQADLLLKPLAAPDNADAGYLSLTLSQPAAGFGTDIYPALVAAISLQNAQILIQQAKAGIVSWLWQKLLALLKQVMACFKNAWANLKKLCQSFFDWLKSLFAGASNLSANDTNEEPEADLTCACLSRQQLLDNNGLYQLPAPPWPVKYNAISLDYHASYQLSLNSSVQAAEQKKAAANYPLAFYHCRPTGLKQLFCASAPGALPASLDLFPIPEFSNACYLALSGLVLPCKLSVYFEVASIRGAAAQTDYTLLARLFCQPKNLALQILQDETRGLRQSGIIVFELPELAAGYSLNLQAANQALLILTGAAPDLQLRLAYLAPQAVRLQRVIDANTPKDFTPVLAAGSIIGPASALPQLSQYYQAFASFGGRAAEQAGSYQGSDSYPLRVAERLLHKDRALSQCDYEILSKQGVDHLYRVMVSKAAKGQVLLAPVLSYRDYLQMHAWRPELSYDQLAQLANYVRVRTAALVRVTVSNPVFQILQIGAEIVLEQDVNIASIQQQINLAIRLYLSPWISCAQTQRQFAGELKRTSIMQVITSFPGVVAIESFQWRYLNDDSAAQLEQAFSASQQLEQDVLSCDQSSLLVSATLHQLGFQYVALAKHADPHSIPLLAIEQELGHVAQG